MRILIFTQYYPPEIGAPQNRLHELAVRMVSKGITVEVLTAMPNYPQMEIQEKYKKETIISEVIDGINVYRAKIYVSKSKKIFSRLLNYFSFVWTSYFRGRKLSCYDFIMVESPPLFLGISAMLLAKRLKASLIFNVSDLWPESAEKLKVVSNRVFLDLAYKLESICYKRSKLITGQTQGIVDSISTRFPQSDTYWLPNGVDLDFFNPDNVSTKSWRLKNNIEDDTLVFYYGGILGLAQNLPVILEAAKSIKGYSDKYKIVIQGSGPDKERIEDIKKRYELNNVLLLPPVTKAEMPEILDSVDISFVPLRSLDLFLGAIPSKIFESLAMKKPLLLGVKGEAEKHFISNAGAGRSYIPDDSNDLAKQIIWFINNKHEVKPMGERGRNYVSEYFNRDVIAEKFIATLSKLNEQ